MSCVFFSSTCHHTSTPLSCSRRCYHFYLPSKTWRRALLISASDEIGKRGSFSARRFSTATTTSQATTKLLGRHEWWRFVSSAVAPKRAAAAGSSSNGGMLVDGDRSDNREEECEVTASTATTPSNSHMHFSSTANSIATAIGGGVAPTSAAVGTNSSTSSSSSAQAESTSTSPTSSSASPISAEPSQKSTEEEKGRPTGESPSKEVEDGSTSSTTTSSTTTGSTTTSSTTTSSTTTSDCTAATSSTSDYTAATSTTSDCAAATSDCATATTTSDCATATTTSSGSSSSTAEQTTSAEAAVSSPSVYLMALPHMGDSITKGSVLKWNKEVGEMVEADEVVCVMETDKGVVKSHGAPEGGEVLVGKTLITLDIDGFPSVPPSGLSGFRTAVLSTERSGGGGSRPGRTTSIKFGRDHRGAEKSSSGGNKNGQTDRYYSDYSEVPAELRPKGLSAAEIDFINSGGADVAHITMGGSWTSSTVFTPTVKQGTTTAAGKKKGEQ
eukprot:GHVS01091911.1.p1 GENE.GHVS01091911.1~~GHVS01091911.1.p1  ORF type:complete len:499 (+),score=183.38 GHVS01091911.1:227-1723(+)